MSSLADETRWMDATAQAELVRTGQVTAAELIEAAITRIQRMDRVINAVIIPSFDKALTIAESGLLKDGPFRGVPFLIKDLYAASAGDPMHNGVRALRKVGNIQPADTTLVARYRAAGFSFIGRTNTPEFGSVPTTEPLAYGPTRNPFDPTRTAGGSSGGSAAAVAAGMVPAAHASDGGGSIRIPAAWCGLVGLKPSQGRMSMGPNLDESGLSVQHVVTRSVRDCAAVLDATHGPGIGDTVIAPAPRRLYVDEVGADPGRLRIGFLATNPRGELHPEHEKAVRETALLLEALGHHVEEAHPPALDDAHRQAKTFTVIWATMMKVSLRRVEETIGRPVGPDDIEPLNLALGGLADRYTSSDYALALAGIAAFRRQLQGWWADGWDLLLTPTCADLPPKLGVLASNPDDPMAPFRNSGPLVPYTPPFNTSGQPAITLPIHWTPAEGGAPKLPVGVQLAAAYGAEDVLIRVAAQLEAARPWAQHRPH